MIQNVKEFIKRHKILYIWFEMYFKLNRKFYLRTRRKCFFTYRVGPFFRNITGRKATKDLLQFKDKYKGKRAFIIATGSSVREEDIMRLKDEITFGVNGAVLLYDKTGWIPTYYCVADSKAYSKVEEVLSRVSIKDMFVPLTLKKQIDNLKCRVYFYDIYEKGVAFLDSVERVRKNVRFNIDIYRKGVHGGRTIVAQALQITAYMGFREIYLYGTDCNYSGKPYFYGGEDAKEQEARDKSIIDMFSFYENAEKVSRKNGFRIYNATRGGDLEAFERVDFDSLFWKESDS